MSHILMLLILLLPGRRASHAFTLHRDRFSEALTCRNAGPQQSDRGFALVQGYAVKAGMLVGRGELLLFMDADGATRVSDVEKLEAALATLFDSGDAASIVMHRASGYATGHGRATHQPSYLLIAKPGPLA